MSNATSKNAGAGSIDPMTLDQSDFSPHPSWPAGNPPFPFAPVSPQANIVNSRSDSVTHQFGQITPPDDDGTVKELKSMPRQPTSYLPSTRGVHSQVSFTAKSERARNAANQRHAKAKKAKKEQTSHVETPSDEDGDGDMDHKREKYREKNRLAAAKCRAKKKMNVEGLEEEAREATARNNKLRVQARELRDTFSELRSHALLHDPSQGCKCGQIHMYNSNKAQEAARGATLMMPPLSHVSSPSADSIGFGEPSPSSSDMESRRQSLNVRGHMAAGHARYYSHGASVSEMAQYQQTDGDDMDFSNFGLDNDGGFGSEAERDGFSGLVQR